MKTFKCENGKMVMLDDSSGDFMYKNDMLLFLERERRQTESKITVQEKQDCSSGWPKEYLESLKDELKLINRFISKVNE